VARTGGHRAWGLMVLLSQIELNRTKKNRFAFRPGVPPGVNKNIIAPRGQTMLPRAAHLFT
jgi:hypothetical protein